MRFVIPRLVLSHVYHTRPDWPRYSVVQGVSSHHTTLCGLPDKVWPAGLIPWWLCCASPYLSVWLVWYQVPLCVVGVGHTVGLSEWQPPRGPRPSHDPPLFVKSNQKLIYFSSEKYATSNQQNTLTDRTSTESGDNSKYIQQRNGEILLTRNEMDF